MIAPADTVNEVGEIPLTENIRFDLDKSCELCETDEESSLSTIDGDAIEYSLCEAEKHLELFEPSLEKSRLKEECPEPLVHVAPKRRRFFSRSSKKQKNASTAAEATDTKKHVAAPIQMSKSVDEPPVASMAIADPTTPSNTEAAPESPTELECDFDVDLTVLFQVLKKRDWEASIKRSTEFPDEAKTWVKRIENDDGKLRWKLLPIHASIVFGAPDSVVLALLMAFPGGAKCMDDQGMLPLHLAVHVGSSETTITLLLGAYPQSTEVHDGNGRTPLDIAVTSNSPHREAYLSAMGPLRRDVEGTNRLMQGTGLPDYTDLPSDFQKIEVSEQPGSKSPQIVIENPVEHKESATDFVTSFLDMVDSVAVAVFDSTDHPDDPSVTSVHEEPLETNEEEQQARTITSPTSTKRRRSFLRLFRSRKNRKQGPPDQNSSAQETTPSPSIVPETEETKDRESKEAESEREGGNFLSCAAFMVDDCGYMFRCVKDSMYDESQVEEDTHEIEAMEVEAAVPPTEI